MLNMGIPVYLHLYYKLFDVIDLLVKQRERGVGEDVEVT